MTVGAAAAAIDPAVDQNLFFVPFVFFVVQPLQAAACSSMRPWLST